MPPVVSINLCCYNGEKYLEEALQSVFSQTYKDWELVVINDGSTDSTEDIIKRYISMGWPIVYHYQSNAGVGAARNKALELSSGSIIAFIDQDDVWMTNKLEKQIPLFDDPTVGLVFSDAILFNEDGKSERLYSKRPYYTGYCFSSLLSDYFLTIQTVVIRRSALDTQDEWFDPRFNMIEEADLFRRISYKWKSDMVIDPLSKYRVHSSNLTFTKPHLLHEETLLMLRKYRKIFPEFNNKFFKEIKILKQKVKINNSITLMSLGNKYEARICLFPFLFSNMKILILFLITFFPMSIISSILKHRMILPSDKK